MSFRFFNLAHNKSEIESRVHAAIDKFPLRSLAVAYQEVPDQRTESPGGSWHFVGLMPLFDSGDTIRRALDLGVNVKMITGGRAFYLFFKVETYYGFDCDQLAIAKETGRRLGMGTNMYPSSALLSQNKDVSLAPLPIYAVSITIRIVASSILALLGFMLLTLIWKFDFPPFMVPILNDGTIMAISKDRVKPSPLPDSWKLAKIFAAGIVLGSYLAIMTVIFFWAAYKTDFFLSAFKVPSLRHTEQDDFKKLASAVYLQIAFTRQKNFGKEACELKWVHAQRSLHGLHSPNTKMFETIPDFFFLICRLTELHTLKGRVESVVKLKGLDIEKIQQAYTL
ncbi:hypothetical protein IFM89_039974 [Coptis chinensis]|uniref:Uncharacterized protein n=1 Tax=Coptis chinensis TaxID=261450 RepID=A0A835GVW3_9MAGN|nr:hypothetical protein IFM89_039974 [Coptis chinensis]